MRLLNHPYRNEAELDAFCQAEGITDDPRLFIQVFCGNLKDNFIHDLNRLLRQRFPRARILGTTTGGEIADGRLFEEGVIISVLVCQRTRLEAVALPWDNPDSFALGQQLARSYGLTRDELRYILDPANVEGEDYPSEAFRVLKNKEINEFGEYLTRCLILEAWDHMI